MCSEWPLIPLRDFVDLLAGFAFKSTGYSDGQDDVRLLRGDNIAPGRVRWDGVKRWSRENAVGLERYALEPGDVVLAMDRPWIPAGLKVAQVQAADTPSYLVQRVARIRPASREDCSFLFALLSTPEFESYIQNVTTGTAVPHISAKQILDFEFRLPPAYVRAKVGEIVAALNERITLLRETNTTLEAMAQALFKSWFVDFDPVHACARGEQPAGLAPEVAALFPDSFEESALGMIPRGWRVLSFTETIDVIGGGTPKTSISEYWNGDIPWFSVVDAPATTDVFVIETEKHITCEGLNKSSTKLLPVGTTIISARGTVGRLALVGQAMAMNQSCYGLSGKAGDVYFTYFSTHRLVETLKQRTHGSVFDTITRDTLAGVSVVYPQTIVITAFEETIAPVMERIKENLIQARTLATLRDTLLPRLISGQLRLPEAEAMVEGAS
ncbi:restriction endonuclease subunit S [Aeromonas hydrophila]|uniref:restriction endonuclease subunit S n=1 Tax=Aeromonas TaxID=642 RepID=UPI00097CFB7B|nr:MULTISPECIES: restriction endonuclease subunit S [Aeromonas]AWA07934.1 restriction endonuclease subunit S [Aeromonas hydrophila subsp. hydrophila]MCE9934268.1 restriction endonuclease subunit S [Aeromonas salmonicida]ONG01779.1 restriction endonuclease subunit S [Aeromonas hydrophila]